MTRSENMRRVKKELEEQNYRKVAYLIDNYYEKYLKPNSTNFNISKLAKDTGLHRNTVSKHITKYYLNHMNPNNYKKLFNMYDKHLGITKE